MKQKDSTILGISLGSKRNGIAIISYGDLIHWQQKTFPGKFSTEKLHAITYWFELCIKKYRVSRMVIKMPPISHRSGSILELFKELLKRAEMHDCIVTYSTKADVKKLVEDMKNKEMLMQYVADNYPVLIREHTQELKSRRSNHLKMFEAVLMAHVERKQIICDAAK